MDACSETHDMVRRVRSLQLGYLVGWASTISSDAIASPRCEGFRAPVIGAETTGLRDTHARAICARDTPRVAAIDATASTMTLSLDWCP
jgi:hypothetical protein